RLRRDRRTVAARLDDVRINGVLAGGAVAGDEGRAAVRQVGALHALGARGGDAPDGHAGRCGPVGDADRCAGGGVETVGGDDEVVPAHGAVAEAHRDTVGVLQ